VAPTWAVAPRNRRHSAGGRPLQRLGLEHARSIFANQLVRKDAHAGSGRMVVLIRPIFHKGCPFDEAPKVRWIGLHFDKSPFRRLGTSGRITRHSSIASRTGLLKHGIQAFSPNPEVYPACNQATPVFTIDDPLLCHAWPTAACASTLSPFPASPSPGIVARSTVQPSDGESRFSPKGKSQKVRYRVRWLLPEPDPRGLGMFIAGAG
jgi:hypothetical protein